MTDVRALDTPYTLGTLELANRFAMAPMTRRHSPGGIPGPEVAEYYARRARGGTALLITEGTYVPDPAAGPDTDVPRLHGEAQLAGWRQVVERVHAEGGKIIPQLWHLGSSRGAEPAHNPEVATVSPSGLATNGTPVGRELTTADLDGLIAAFAEAAANAKAVGFDGLELHGAHGYLLDQFLWGPTNRRTDAYGGPLAARTRFPAEVVAAVRAEVGPDFPIVYRFSQWKDADFAARIADDPAELEEVLTPLVRAGVDALHPSTRRHYQAAFPELGGRDGELGLAGWTKKVTGLPVITVGSVGLDSAFLGGTKGDNGIAQFSGVERLLEQFEAGEFDLVALGRTLLSDPEWVDKVLSGRTDEIITYTNDHRRNFS
ncbi:NADH:flavin oxidoreductase [Actinokineospora bangkokensis]|uniref:12-oxophytodienoate reductase n=1 Tax=Actinokineospora bangkokensis TaxID=1193682 RepID=A0A1Q9LKE9_9PSEU|nr:NADH:flavin oxidoreductase [Actinokineospora bangkokensis]OLR92465.1 12-oxophytodienoate reductase [Actinokineospora bangkokensis]